MIFKNFDPESGADPLKPLSFAEKLTIRLFSGYVRVLLKKAGKAQTYGDLYKMGRHFEKIDEMIPNQKEFDELSDEEQESQTQRLVEEMTREAENNL